MVTLIEGATKCISLKRLCGLDISLLRGAQEGRRRYFAQEQLGPGGLAFLAISVRQAPWRTIDVSNSLEWNENGAALLGEAIAYEASAKAQTVTTFAVRGARIDSKSVKALALNMGPSRALRCLILGPWRPRGLEPLDPTDAKRYKKNLKKKRHDPFDLVEADSLAHGQLLIEAAQQLVYLTEIHFVGNDLPILPGSVAIDTTQDGDDANKRKGLLARWRRQTPATTTHGAPEAPAQGTPAETNKAAEGAARLSTALKGCKRLVKVTLSHCPLPMPTPTEHVLCSLLQLTTTLRTVDVSSTGLTDDSAHALLHALSPGHRSGTVIELNLSHNKLTDKLVYMSVDASSVRKLGANQGVASPNKTTAGVLVSSFLACRGDSGSGRGSLHNRSAGGLLWLNLAHNKDLTTYVGSE
jgi:hypothetical protein